MKNIFGGGYTAFTIVKLLTLVERVFRCYLQDLREFFQSSKVTKLPQRISEIIFKKLRKP